MVLLRRYGAYSGVQVQRWQQLMRLQVEAYADNGRATPRSIYSHERRVGIIDIIDRWYGPDCRYVKVKGDDRVYICAAMKFAMNGH